MLANSPELYHNSCTLLPRSDTIRALPGRVAEWLNAAVLKTADASSVRGFESHPFRHFCPVDDLADVVRQMILSTAAVSYLPQ